MMTLTRLFVVKLDEVCVERGQAETGAIYERHFEGALLEATRNLYAGEVARLIHSIPFNEFIQFVSTVARAVLYTRGEVTSLMPFS